MSNIASPGSGNLELIKRIEDLEASNEFSLEEKRIGTWIDGKPLYRKTIETVLDWGSSTDYTQKIIPLNTPGIKIITDIKTILYKNQNAYTIPYIKDTGISTFIYAIDIDDAVVTFRNKNANWSNYTLNITIEYTKITD